MLSYGLPRNICLHIQENLQFDVQFLLVLVPKSIGYIELLNKLQNFFDLIKTREVHLMAKSDLSFSHSDFTLTHFKDYHKMLRLNY